MVLTAALLALGLTCASAEAQNTRTAGVGQSRESPHITNDCGYRCLGTTIVIPLGARPRVGDDAVML